MKKVRKPDVAIVGAGPAGLAAALSAKEAGLRDVMLIERDIELGGILPQCIHDGFGSIIFKETLTGPDYAQRYINRVGKTNIDVKLNTLVLDLKPNKTMTAVNSTDGIFDVEPKSVILAMGSRERTRHQILIPGFRPAGVITAGAAQRYINIEGLMPGKEFVILGSGDIGLIMARRVTLEGGHVTGVFEVAGEPGGLTRNVVQCLHDYDIPLHLSHTVTFIHGRKRVQGVNVARVDENMKPLKETEKFIECDTLMLSVGLIPENELSKKAGIELDPVTGGPIVDERMETSVDGIFACGNVVSIYDLVDYVSRSAEAAGVGAFEYVNGKKRSGRAIKVVPGNNVKFTVPQVVRSLERPVSLYFRVEEPRLKVVASVSVNGEEVARKKERKVRPPEMVKIDLKPERLSAAGEEMKEIQLEVAPSEK
ncbi:MAG: FAD-dependent oxidoreductase [Actinomycetota bacterium]|nr:FAD-dependent oxidoreductase [Actinomycetota bacterium]